MKLDNKNKCLIATPVLHLPKVAELIESHNSLFEIDENISYDNLCSLLRSRKDITALLVNPNAQGFVIDEALIKHSNLKCINTCSTGLNHINIAACQSKGIKIYSLTNDYDLINNLPSTSELALCMMLSLFRNIPKCLEYVKEGKWEYKGVMGHQVQGATIGVLGYGRLGKIFCEQLSGFGVNILVCEKSESVDIPPEYKRVNIKTLFETSHAVAIHIHSNAENFQIINGDLLKIARDNMYLVNTSRGDIVNEDHVAASLLSGKLGGYATDVLATEFGNLEESPILKLYKQQKFNIAITPHVGGMTIEGQEKAYAYALKKFSFS